MNPSQSPLRAAISATITLAVLCCAVYPLLVLLIAQVVFPGKANGSLVRAPDGQVLGSRLIGQGFGDIRHFHPRPSAAGEQGYDATASGGSNLGPTSTRLRDLVAKRIENYRSLNGLGPADPVPADAVTASASGLDPHISRRNALLQAPRVARARGLPVAEIERWVTACTDTPDLGFLGEPGVNVLRLNLALDSVR